MTAARLEVAAVSAGYGGALALRDVSLEARPGELVAIVGPNGAGKTTLLRAVAGLTPTRAGAIRLDGRRVDGLPAYRIAALGLAAAPEGRRLFDELTVRENLELGAWTRPARQAPPATAQLVARLFPALATRAGAPAGTLSGGEQQMVAIGRALLADPRLLLLDDPFLGLAPGVVAPLGAALRELVGARRTTIVAAGQHVRRLLRLADRGYVLDQGHVVAKGPGAALLDDPGVRARLLGATPPA